VRGACLLCVGNVSSAGISWQLNGVCGRGGGVGYEVGKGGGGCGVCVSRGGDVPALLCKRGEGGGGRGKQKEGKSRISNKNILRKPACIDKLRN
jgi:hypothetical protein